MSYNKKTYLALDADTLLSVIASNQSGVLLAENGLPDLRSSLVEQGHGYYDFDLNVNDLLSAAKELEASGFATIDRTPRSHAEWLNVTPAGIAHDRRDCQDDEDVTA